VNRNVSTLKFRLKRAIQKPLSIVLQFTIFQQGEHGRTSGVSECNVLPKGLSTPESDNDKITSAL